MSKVVYYVKGFFALLALTSCAVYGVIASTVLSLLGKRNLSQWSTARVFYATFSTLFNITIEVDRPEILEKLPAILVSNHQSELDVFILGKVFPKRCSMTSKKQLKWVPFLGQFMTLSGVFFLDRANKSTAISTLDTALQKLKNEKGALYIFPEGTRSYALEPKLLPFKKGAFHMAVQGGIPVIPIVASNTSSLYSPKTKTFKSGVIKIKVLDPIETKDLTKDDVADLTQEVYDKMKTAVDLLGYSPTNDHLEAETDEDTETESEAGNTYTDTEEDVTVPGETTQLLDK
ncbi:BA75_01703T0 [Komagataella pastoris]|uniref:1-acyl-sn-glycerol-3-phosphate acyltransferase n=1 Tax=Komagataella pastoris TaxID=4922 RepID=A0A1B2J726_PICPA|nr:BA75_01703T0 [Komagataella pastoris]